MGQIKISEEATTPETPPTGFYKLYVKPNGFLYLLNDNGDEVQLSDTDVLVSVSANDTVPSYLEEKIVAAVGTNATNALEITTLNDGADEDIQVQFDESKINITASQVTDFSTAVTNAETDTTLQKIGNTLRYVGENGLNQDINLSIYLDDTNLARLTSATLDGVTGIATFTRDDATTFTLDLSNLLDNQNASEVPVTPTGNLTSTDVQNALEELQGDVDTLSGSSHTQNTDTSLDNGNPNQVTASELRTHLDDTTIHFTQAAISITASQVSDFDTEVSNNTDVTANTSARHDAVTLNVDAPTQESANLVGQELQLNQATASTDGVMSSEDKTKLDAVESGANNYTHPNHSGEISSIADGATTAQPSIITNKTTISAEAGDFVLVSDTSDGGNLKKVNIDDLLDDTNTGENNTASNVGVGGVGVFKQKTGVDLEFKNINAGSNKISITDDVATNEIDIDVNENNLTITSSQVSDIQTTIDNNTNVLANTTARHDAVTLNAGAVTQESANLVGQELELNQATTISDGVMSSEDKTKLDGIEANANNYVHPNHTGEVTSTGDGAQVVDKTAISNQTEVTAATDDYILIGDTSDLDNLKKVTAQSIADLFNGNNGLVSKADSVAGASFVTASGDKVYDVVFSTAFADANYSVSISASIERMWTWESKTATGFRINAHSNNDLTGETVDWVATKHGES